MAKVALDINIKNETEPLNAPTHVEALVEGKLLQLQITILLQL